MDCSIDIESDDDYDADADDNGNIIAYAYFIKLSFVVKVCEKLYIKIDWNVLLPLLSVTSRNANYCYVCAPFYFMFYTLLPFLPYMHKTYIYTVCSLRSILKCSTIPYIRFNNWHIKFLVQHTVHRVHGQYFKNTSIIIQNVFPISPYPVVLSPIYSLLNVRNVQSKRNSSTFCDKKNLVHSLKFWNEKKKMFHFETRFFIHLLSVFIE